MTTTATRPPEFDASVLRWIPMLRKKAGARDLPKGYDPDDIVQETVEVALRRWESYDPKNSLPGWLSFIMRERIRSVGKTRSVSAASYNDTDDAASAIERVGLPAQQLRAVELSQVVGKMKGVEREILLRLARGDLLEEIGADRGQTRQAVHIAERRARSSLRKRLNTVRVAA